MESPYTFAELPKPLNSNGRRYAAPVYSLRGGVKRKRREVVVGTDQASVMIFNVQNQTLASSYAIPPQTSFACEPVSFWTPAIDTRPAQRDTFIVLEEDGRKDGRSKLLRITEKASKDIEFTQPVTTSFLLPAGSVVGVEVLPSKDSSLQALVVYQDGTVVIVAKNLNRQVSQVSVCTNEEQENCRVLHATTADVFSARKGLLKGRDDVIALLDTAYAQAHSLAAFIIRRNDETLLRLCAVGSASEQAVLNRLDDIYLPSHVSSATSHSQWQIRSSNGQVAHLVDGKLHLLDLSKTVPRSKLVIDQMPETIAAFTPTSSSSIMTVTSDRATLYDTSYGSILATKSLDGSQPTDQSSKKRKRDHKDHSTARLPVLIEFMSINKVVIVGESLIAIDVDQSISALHSKNTRSVALADIAGKGTISIKDLQQDAWRAQLRPAVESHDANQLEEICIEGLSLQDIPSEDQIVSSDDGAPSTARLWALHDASYDLTQSQKSRAIVLLGSLFTIKRRKNELGSIPTLRLRIVSRNLLRWLFTTEILTVSNLSAVLETTITARDIAEALGQADPSFELLLDILILPAHLPLDFLIECARLLIRSMDTTLPAELLNGELTNDELELESAELELSTALATLSSGLELRSVVMERVLGRLYAFPQQMLTKHLRAGLEQRDLLFLINILRIELADAGWTKRYLDDTVAPVAGPEAIAPEVDGDPEATALMKLDSVDENMTDDLPTPSNRAIQTIGNLFNAIVDAIGLAGWLVGLGEEDDDSYNMINVFQAEISAALESVSEAHSLDAYLRDFDKYVESAQLSSQVNVPSKQDEVVKVIEETTSDAETSAMPLGGRSGIIAQLQPTSKIKKTKQSKLNRAKERERFVGLYQFEQIRV